MFSENKGSATQLYSGSCYFIFSQWYHGFAFSAFTFIAEQVVSCNVYEKETKNLERNWISLMIEMLQNFPALT